MSLKARISEDMKSAMKARETERLAAIRLLMAAIKQKEVDERVELDDAGITAVVDNAAGLPPRDKAFTLLAELMLFQHTCHWYCKSLPVASARLLLRHQTPYAKVLASVSPQTRQAYAALTGR